MFSRVGSSAGVLDYYALVNGERQFPFLLIEKKKKSVYSSGIHELYFISDTFTLLHFFK